MRYTKSDLVYEDYNWSAGPGDNPNLTGTPDNDLFSRHEGYEMLYMINRLMEQLGLHEQEEGQRLERMLREELPGDVRSRERVRRWVMENW